MNSEELFNKIQAEFLEDNPNRRAWGIINEFYHYLLTYMDANNISRADLARRAGKSRSAVSQMFNKTPNLTIRKMVEIADAVGLEIEIIPKKIKATRKIEKKSANKSIESKDISKVAAST
jgi:transcriptional regulator with XRE-family HTH domain